MNGGMGLTIAKLIERDAETRDLPEEVVEMLNIHRNDELTLKRDPEETVIVDK